MSVENLGPPTPPTEVALTAFDQSLSEIKHELIRLRRQFNKEEPDPFEAADLLSDSELLTFISEDLESIRIAETSWGCHLFGKLRLPTLPDTGPAYIHVRLYVNLDQGTIISKLHNIHIDRRRGEGGTDEQYHILFDKDEDLAWFDS